MKLHQALLVTVLTTGLSGAALAEGFTNKADPADQGQTQERSDWQSDSISPRAGDTSATAVTTADAGQIEDVQSTLKDKGYSVSVDGVMGPRTTSAIRNFQSDNDLSVTGTLNSETLAALDVSSSTNVNR